MVDDSVVCKVNQTSFLSSLTVCLQVEVDGFPYVFVVTYKDVAEKSELLIDYGEAHRRSLSEPIARRPCA